MASHNQFSISVATRDQAPALVALMESAYRGDESKKGWTSEADLIDGPRTTLDDMNANFDDLANTVLVAMNNEGKLLGCACVTIKGDDAYFGQFAVNPSLQASGIGGALMQACEKFAHEEKRAVRMTMTVVENRPELEAFYERRGYKRTGQFVRMADFHLPDGMTRGHDLILNELAKVL